MNPADLGAEPFPASLMFRFLISLILAGTLGLSPTVAQSLGELGLLSHLSDTPQAFEFDTITELDGLSTGLTLAIAQDAQGFMWFATQYGLNRYDGHEVTSFFHEDQDSTSLASDWVETLLVDRSGALWVGTYGGGLQQYDPVQERFERVPLVENARLTSGSAPDSADRSLAAGIVHLFEDRDGALWIGTRGGLFRRDPDGETLEWFRHDPNDPNSLSADEVRLTYQDREGTIWVGTGQMWDAPIEQGGLNRFRPATGDFFRYQHDPSDPSSLANNKVSTIYEDAAGRLWVGTLGYGLHVLDRETGRFRRYLFDPETQRLRRSRNGPAVSPCLGSVCPLVTFLREETPGTYWAGLFGVGTVGYESPPLDDMAASVPFTMVSPAQAPRPFDFFQGGDGTRWLSDLGGGILKIRPSTEQFPSVTLGDSGIDYGFVAMVTMQSGEVLLATRRAGLHRIDPTSGTVRTYRHEPKNERSLPDAIPQSMYADERGEVWIGTDGAGLVRFDPLAETFATHPVAGGEPGDNRVFSIAGSRDGRLWVGTELGLRQFDPVAETYSPILYSLREGSDRIRSVLVVHEDERGRVWVGGTTGLYELVFNGAGDLVVSKEWLRVSNSDAALSLHPDAQGRLWLGMSASGLYLADPGTGRLAHFTKSHGLASNDVRAIVEDRDGNLWISTSSGSPGTAPTRGRLSRFNLETRSAVAFGPEDGLPEIGFIRNSGTLGPDGTLFFGGTIPTGGRVVLFNPSLTQGIPPPPTRLTRLSVFNQIVGPGPGEPISEPLSRASSIVLPHDRDNFTLEYAALNYADPGRTRYQYRLVPYDAGWVDAGTLRSARYAQVPPGEYVFQVRASNRYGVWNEEPTEIAVRVLPPWWRTVWAYGFYLLALGTGVFGVDRLQRRRVVARERERTRERELAQAREIERQHAELTQAHESLKSTQAQLVQTEKLASLGQLTSGIAHELKNPLNFVNNFAELNEELAREARGALEQDPAEADRLLLDLESNARQIARHGKRADAIVASMMAHATAGSSERLVVDVNDFVAEYVRIASGAFATRRPDLKIRIDERYDPAAGSVRMAPQELGRALVNILSNAFEATSARIRDGRHEAHAHKPLPSEGPYDPAVTVTTHRTNTGVEIRIADDGMGIAEEVLPRVFEPFFTTKSTGEGTGLGLSLAHDIVVQGHRGKLEVESEKGQGATFVVTLPI